MSGIPPVNGIDWCDRQSPAAPSRCLLVRPGEGEATAVLWRGRGERRGEAAQTGPDRRFLSAPGRASLPRAPRAVPASPVRPGRSRHEAAGGRGARAAGAPSDAGDRPRGGGKLLLGGGRAPPRWLRVATVCAYFLCVSLAALLLVIYYGLVWAPRGPGAENGTEPGPRAPRLCNHSGPGPGQREAAAEGALGGGRRPPAEERSGRQGPAGRTGWRGRDGSH
ncbi:putative transmembrane protein INAFM1 [Mauremys reevesii]|uniref:putative transmembrane protein INAFM1 n=1 Tax=Mauremys reevesii TaxID=260615 RepID=UPI00193EE612|nr:putative transmembrane protein INAFM1 [Mauremys reevesii]